MCLVAVLIIAMVSFSCEKVVSVDLNNASPHLVIEGVVSNQQGPYSVALSESGDYFQPSLYFAPVMGATVTIADNAGDLDTLRESTGGTYVSSRLQGVPGRTYSLTVDAGGNFYNATSSMPEEVKIDSVYALQFREFDGDRGYTLHVMFRDPPAPGNWYRIDLHTSTLPSDSITGQRFILSSDKLTNGNEANMEIRVTRPGMRRVNTLIGDTLSVYLYSIDKATYDFFNTVNIVLETDRSPTSLSPANPNTDLTNGALGYFAAWSVDSSVIVLQ